MDKGYYYTALQGETTAPVSVAIHNKNGQGLLHLTTRVGSTQLIESQSTIKMDKGYYWKLTARKQKVNKSQSTIKMDKGYYPKYRQ